MIVDVIIHYLNVQEDTWRLLAPLDGVIGQWAGLGCGVLSADFELQR